MKYVSNQSVSSLAEKIVQALSHRGTLDPIVVANVLLGEMQSPFDEFEPCPEIPHSLELYQWAVDRLKTLCTTGDHFQQVLACQSLIEMSGKFMMGYDSEERDL